MTWNFSEAGSCKVTMKGFTQDLLTEFGVTGTIGSPAANHLFKIREDAKKLDAKTKEKYHTGVAKCAYMGKRTRPDILLPVSFLSTRVHAPDEDDWSKFMRVLKYLNGSPDLGINLQCDIIIKVKTYIDAAYASHHDFRSHTGMMITLGGGPIDVSSTKQKITAKSSAEAELIGFSDKASQAIWCSNFIIGQGYKNSLPAIIYQDNMSTIALGKNGQASSDRTRHVSIRYFWAKDRVDSGDIEIIYCPTSEMIADILTKPLHGEAFVKFRQLLLNWKC
jgi:hypothetical protein